MSEVGLGEYMSSKDVNGTFADYSGAFYEESEPASPINLDYNIVAPQVTSF